MHFENALYGNVQIYMDMEFDELTKLDQDERRKELRQI